MFLAVSTVDSFLEFVQQYPPERSQRFSSLSHYIHEWLQSCEAPKECVGNFSVYLQTIILIIIAWQENPQLLDFRGKDGVVVQRRVEVVDDSGPTEQDYHWIDYEYFNYFNYLAHRSSF